tara:strand:+ start:1471 stop:1617 length:147 start_codon:yes stop_codon:yes gene_type:complete
MTNDEACDFNMLEYYSIGELVCELKRRKDFASEIARLVNEAELGYDGN